MFDNILGELHYDGGWSKKYDASFWGKNITLRLVVSAYENEQPNENQRLAYKKFTDSIAEISSQSLVKLKEYLSLIEEEVLLYCGIDRMPEDIWSIVSINHVLFLESGSFAIICDARWDTHGVAVLCKATEMIAGPQDIVWFE